ncbi:hypothetical protein KR054_005095, partial [Drosophila jambulina]
LQLIKIGLLLLLWCFFAIVLIGAPINNRKTSVVTVLPKETVVRELLLPEDAFKVVLQGPIDAILQKFPNNEENAPAVGVRLEFLDSITNLTTHSTDMWNVYLQKKELDNVKMVSHLFIVPNSKEIEVHGLLSLENKCEYPVALVMETDDTPIFTHFGIVYSVLLLLGLYILIFFEVTDPTLGVLLMATTGLATLAALGERPGLPMITTWVDLRIIMLLLSLMIISGITSETGIFDWLAIQTYHVSKGHKWLLLFFLAIVTALLSSFLPNVTIVLLMSPIAVLVCEVIPVQTPLVIFVVIVYANIGGALTLVGDPLNMYIATHTDVQFLDFTLHMFPGVLCGLLVALPVIYLSMRRNLTHLGDHQIKATAKREDERPWFIPEVANLEEWLRKRHSMRSCIKPSENYFGTLAYLQTHYGIRDKVLLAKSLVVVLFVQISFVFHTEPFVMGGSLHLKALMGATLLIILAKLDDMETVLHYLDWSVVLFLGAHFVFIAVVHELGLGPWLRSQAIKVVSSVEKSHQTTVAILLVIWLTAFLTALVNNIAVTEMSLGLIKDLTMNREINVPLSPLIWALSYGASFGANGTLFGAHANLMGVFVARRFGYHITFLQYFRYGFPIMLASLTAASAYLLIAQSL